MDSTRFRLIQGEIWSNTDKDASFAMLVRLSLLFMRYRAWLQVLRSGMETVLVLFSYLQLSFIGN